MAKLKPINHTGTVRGVTLKMRSLYGKVSAILDTVDFGGIWRGFSRVPFALYNGERVFLRDEVIPYDRRFLGNTSIEYGGGYIAIWNVADPSGEDPELLAADMVHEMFHAFQRQNGETRYPDDLLLLSYPDDEENYAVKYAENLLLADVFDESGLDAKKETLGRFLGARRYRESLVPNHIRQEYLTETIEGMAEYAGCMALKFISAEKYKRRVAGYAEKLRTLDGSFFDIRRGLYNSGALLCLALRDTGADFTHSVGKTERTLFDIAAGDTRPLPPTVDRSRAAAAAAEHIAAKKSMFEAFLSAHSGEVAGDWFICGYDPMNMVRLGDMLLCCHFVMLQGSGSEPPEFLQGPVLVKLKNGTANRVEGYIA
ncbi:MAG: hypothetical protein LBR72_02180 [Oscillospiraceae bacterium]|jgi:hypothetical protein|nr:hypothetical protein [Oscillospiraceae bacterium]